MKRAILTIGIALGAIHSLPAAAQDAAAGQRVFSQCRVCHVIEDNGRNGVGPNLHGVVGRKAASVASYSYSPAMKAKGEEGWIWTEENLNTYLENPRGVVPGTKMSFPGLKDETQRKNVIAFLKSQG
ncbi:cytochrome c family protein [Roseicella sp. DB1501]|uniref:c-type cytochrome n=1 Tax=Roseicella sp. DB1501 TaxID=2730925 RepID=UPI001491098F|nr:cytochrome c family protein [Roseicella sp. DB1501]NOG71916.1 cytochrome c family protein [Roseicella sp. DB1501]